MTVHGMRRQVSIEIAADPETLYAVVSDLPRMGELSPENIGGEWQEGGSGQVGDRFLGHNRIGEREWSALCEVVVADRGRHFEFVTRPDIGPCVRWSYRFEPVAFGTRVTETWDVLQLPPSLEGRTQEQLDQRAATVLEGMVTTLENLKAQAEQR